MRRRAFGYCRVSHARQVEEGDSLEMQQRRIAAISANEDYELIQVFIEPGVSASIPFAEREQGKALLASVKKGDVVVALKGDRVFRDAYDALATKMVLRKLGADLHLQDSGGIIRDDALGDAMFGVQAIFAQLERSRISERIRDAKAFQRAQARFLGGKHTPFGYRREQRDDGKTYLEPIEPIHAEARRLKADGVSLRRAAEHFQALGHQVSHCGVAALYRSL